MLPVAAPELRDLIGRVERLERSVGSGGGDGDGRIALAQLDIVIKDVQTLSARLERVLQALSGTAGYRLRETFECSSCGQKGHVAVKVKCTNCENEMWWGWWPGK